MTEKRFAECEYFQHSDNTWILGYCTNPILHKKINSVALMCCQGYACPDFKRRVDKTEETEWEVTEVIKRS